MKKICSLLCVVATLATQSQGATVGWGAQISNSLGLDDGSLTPQGSLVRLGYFTVSDAMIQTLAAAEDKSGLNAAFVEFGTSLVGNGYGIDGVWDQNSVNVNTAFWSPTPQSIYYWTLNAPTLGAATQWGVFKLPSTFPSDSPTPGSIVTDLSHTPTNSSGLIVGTFGGGPDANFGNPLYKMVYVPEPTSSALLLLGLAGLGLRRKRSSK